MLRVFKQKVKRNRGLVQQMVRSEQASLRLRGTNSGTEYRGKDLEITSGPGLDRGGEREANNDDGKTRKETRRGKEEEKRYSRKAREPRT